MTQNTFDPNKPVQTRDGRKARIVATDVREWVGGACHSIRYEGQTILATTESENGEELFRYFYPCGGFKDTAGNFPADLVNVPERTERFHTFKFVGERGISEPALMLGGLPKSTAAEARELAVLSWHGVAKVVTIDGAFVSAEVVPAAA